VVWSGSTGHASLFWERDLLSCLPLLAEDTLPSSRILLDLLFDNSAVVEEEHRATDSLRSLLD